MKLSELIESATLTNTTHLLWSEAVKLGFDEESSNKLGTHDLLELQCVVNHTIALDPIRLPTQIHFIDLSVYKKLREKKLLICPMSREPLSNNLLIDRDQQLTLIHVLCEEIIEQSLPTYLPKDTLEQIKRLLEEKDETNLLTTANTLIACFNTLAAVQLQEQLRQERLAREEQEQFELALQQRMADTMREINEIRKEQDEINERESQIQHRHAELKRLCADIRRIQLEADRAIVTEGLRPAPYAKLTLKSTRQNTNAELRAKPHTKLIEATLNEIIAEIAKSINVINELNLPIQFELHIDGTDAYNIQIIANNHTPHQKQFIKEMFNDAILPLFNKRCLDRTNSFDVIKKDVQFFEKQMRRIDCGYMMLYDEEIKRLQQGMPHGQGLFQSRFHKDETTQKRRPPRP